MMRSIFAEGKKQTIAQVLAGKDARAAVQQEFFRKYPQYTLLDVKLNIPGPIKNNRYLEQLFFLGITDLEKLLRQNKLSFSLFKNWDKVTGCESFYLLSADSQLVKKVAIQFEDESRIGRLFDADVLIKNKKEALSRSELSKPVRRCFLCKRPAKECARSRRHSVRQLQNYINYLYEQEIS